MDRIEFNHQRGGGCAGVIGDITHERVYITSNFVAHVGVEVFRCDGVTVNKEQVAEPAWGMALIGEWKPSTKNPRWEVGKIALQGDGLFYFKVRGYTDIFFELSGQDVNPVARGDIEATVERMFAEQVTERRNELASIKAAHQEEFNLARKEAEQQGWPTLTGSEKQIAWAMTIRSKVARSQPLLPELRTRTAAKFWIEQVSSQR